MVKMFEVSESRIPSVKAFDVSTKLNKKFEPGFMQISVLEMAANCHIFNHIMLSLHIKT